MEEQERFNRMVRDTLAGYGVEVDDTDLAVLGAIEQVYGPERNALLAADLSDVEPEHDFDPGRAPSRQGRTS
jgi:hypothetical protein